MSSNHNAYLSIIESTPFLELMPEIESDKKYRVFFKDEDSKQIALAISKIHSQVVVLLKKIENERGNNFFTLNPNRKFKKEQALREISLATISCSSKSPNIENIIKPSDLKNIKDIIEKHLNNKDITSGIISTRTKDTLSHCLEITNEILTQPEPVKASKP